MVFALLHSPCRQLVMELLPKIHLLYPEDMDCIVYPSHPPPVVDHLETKQAKIETIIESTCSAISSVSNPSHGGGRRSSRTQLIPPRCSIDASRYNSPSLQPVSYPLYGTEVEDQIETMQPFQVRFPAQLASKCGPADVIGHETRFIYLPHVVVGWRSKVKIRFNGMM